ncbi:MAG: acyl-CoA thioesterase [Myxococcota bacterium]
MGDFEIDTRVEPVDEDAGLYRAELSSDWEIWGPNGGYIAAIALRAAGRAASIPRPASFNAHFLSVARFEPVELRVRVVRRGRRSESLAVSLTQQGKPVLEALVRTASAVAGLEHDRARMPDVPEPESLASADELRDPEWPIYAFWQNLDSRPLHPERFREPPTARDPEFREWYRLRPRSTFDDPFVDAGRVLMLIDTLSWPAAVRPHPDSAFIAPNLDVSAWFHRPAPECEWLLADHRCDLAESGLMGTHGRVWSRDGRLLATGGAQLMCVPAPPRD